jgi:hypothetical protein
MKLMKPRRLIDDFDVDVEEIVWSSHLDVL